MLTQLGLRAVPRAVSRQSTKTTRTVARSYHDQTLAPHTKVHPYNEFKPPRRIRQMWKAKAGMALVWFWVLYRGYHDNFIGHLLHHHHSWDDPKAIAYLEELDKKYGTRYSIDNYGHH
ncbi:hypothetical protein HDV00_007647 [Rhizophlyctis rosea]|nr:hypothetical protein HDV00_007647 [Rhizophlyctis rosea]